MQQKTLKVFQVDITNHCSAVCDYCPHPTHERARGFIGLGTFAQAMRVASNDIVQLHHFGEPLLHSELPEILTIARDAGKTVGFSTNGLGRRKLDRDYLRELIDAGLGWMRLHTDPHGIRIAGLDPPDGFELTEHAIEADNGAKKKERVTFAGQVDGPAPVKRRRCSFIHDEWRVVLWNGDVALCCHDIEGGADESLCEGCEGYVFKNPRDDWGEYDG